MATYATLLRLGLLLQSKHSARRLRLVGFYDGVVRLCSLCGDSRTSSSSSSYCCCFKRSQLVLVLLEHGSLQCLNLGLHRLELFLVAFGDRPALLNLSRVGVTTCLYFFRRVISFCRALASLRWASLSSSDMAELKIFFCQLGPRGLFVRDFPKRPS